MSKIFLHGLLIIALFNNLYAGVPNENGEMLYTNKISNERTNTNQINKNPFVEKQNTNDTNINDEHAAAPALINGVTPYGDVNNTPNNITTLQNSNSNQSNITTTPSNAKQKSINKNESVQNMNKNTADINKISQQLNAATDLNTDNNLKELISKMMKYMNDIVKQQEINTQIINDAKKLQDDSKTKTDEIVKNFNDVNLKVLKIGTTKHLMFGDQIRKPNNNSSPSKMAKLPVMVPNNIIYPSKDPRTKYQLNKRLKQKQMQQAVYNNSLNYNSSQYNNTNQQT
ncbi:MAG: hypothetical protein IJU54_02840 [Alphaproteobacteria bacterium]|nr:hypothetical protein [Alphaproteobacteria bacterium]